MGGIKSIISHSIIKTSDQGVTSPMALARNIVGALREKGFRIFSVGELTPLSEMVVGAYVKQILTLENYHNYREDVSVITDVSILSGGLVKITTKSLCSEKRGVIISNKPHYAVISKEETLETLENWKPAKGFIQQNNGDDGLKCVAESIRKLSNEVY